IARPDDAAENVAAGAPEQHASGEDGLGGGAALLRKSTRNHGLSGRGVCRFPKPYESPREEEKKETESKTTSKGCATPEENPNGDNGFAAETIRKEAKRYAGNREDH